MPVQLESVEAPTAQQTIKLTDAYPNLRPDLAYLSGNHGSWPDVQGLPFCIYKERMEDQLDAEAEAASPLHYEDDDKENDVINPEFIPRPNPLDNISIIPASHYPRSSVLQSTTAHQSIASNALYLQPQFEASPYGLGWSDGAFDQSNGDAHDCPITDYFRILTSGEILPGAHSPPETCLHSNDALVSSSPVRNLAGIDLRR